jgi:hypothetical protein
MQKSSQIISEFVKTVRAFRMWHDPAQVEALIMDMGINGEKTHELPGELVAYMGIVDGDAKPPEGSLVNMEPKSVEHEDLGDDDFEALLGGPDGVRAELRDALNRASRGRRDGRHGERRR